MKTIKKQKTDIYRRVTMLLLESPLETISMMHLRNMFEKTLYLLKLSKRAQTTEFKISSDNYLKQIDKHYKEQIKTLEHQINHTPKNKEEYTRGDEIYAEIDFLREKLKTKTKQEEKNLEDKLTELEKVYKKSQKILIDYEEFQKLLYSQCCYWKIIDQGRKLFFYNATALDLKPWRRTLEFSFPESVLEEHNIYEGSLFFKIINDTYYVIFPDWEDIPIGITSERLLHQWIIKTLKKNPLTRQIIELEMKHHL